MTRKVRVLHIIRSLGPGGAERLVLNLMEAADKERFEVAVVSVYPASGTILEKEAQAKGLKVFHLNKRRGLDLRMVPLRYRLLRALRPDVVHTHLDVLRYFLFPIILCRIPVRVHTIHNVAQKEVNLYGKIVHWVAFRLGKVIPVSISQEVARTVKEVYGKDIVTPVIYNGIPTQRFVSGNKRREDGRIILIHIGRFSPQKNHFLLIEAFCLVLKEYPFMELWLVGDGRLRPEVEKMVTEKGLEEKVRFLGLRDDVPDLLAKADFLVLSSDWEGFGLVITEAMAAGKPVVATAVGGVPELVEDGVSGILVPPRDPHALAKGILQLARDADLRSRMGKVAQERALERFDISRTAREYEALYLKLLKERGRI